MSTIDQPALQLVVNVSHNSPNQSCGEDELQQIDLPKYQTVEEKMRDPASDPKPDCLIPKERMHSFRTFISTYLDENPQLLTNYSVESLQIVSKLQDKLNLANYRFQQSGNKADPLILSPLEAAILTRSSKAVETKFVGIKESMAELEAQDSRNRQLVRDTEQQLLIYRVQMQKLAAGFKPLSDDEFEYISKSELVMRNHQLLELGEIHEKMEKDLNEALTKTYEFKKEMGLWQGIHFLHIEQCERDSKTVRKLAKENAKLSESLAAKDLEILQLKSNLERRDKKMKVIEKKVTDESSLQRQFNELTEQFTSARKTWTSREDSLKKEITAANRNAEQKAEDAKAARRATEVTIEQRAKLVQKLHDARSSVEKELTATKNDLHVLKLDHEAVVEANKEMKEKWKKIETKFKAQGGKIVELEKERDSLQSQVLAFRPNKRAEEGMQRLLRERNGVIEELKTEVEMLKGQRNKDFATVRELVPKTNEEQKKKAVEGEKKAKSIKIKKEGGQE
ncbi:hypothetical protein B7494_g5386 [Chlorociboria aeruginascens]|nr:hypothetical protein B7494_g5386 [Chlorociboria aeruginascens]